MVNFLQENLQGNYVANADGTPLLSDADADGSEADRADTLSDIGSDGREPAGQILLRYFRAIVAKGSIVLKHCQNPGPEAGSRSNKNAA